MNNMQLFKLLMLNHADKEVKIIDEDANLTFTRTWGVLMRAFSGLD